MRGNNQGPGAGAGATRQVGGARPRARRARSRNELAQLARVNKPPSAPTRFRVGAGQLARRCQCWAWAGRAGVGGARDVGVAAPWASTGEVAMCPREEERGGGRGFVCSVIASRHSTSCLLQSGPRRKISNKNPILCHTFWHAYSFFWVSLDSHFCVRCVGINDCPRSRSAMRG